jgi:hypothetical protein
MGKTRMNKNFLILILVLFLLLAAVRNGQAGVTMGTESLDRYVETVQPLYDVEKTELTPDEMSIIQQYQVPPETFRPTPTPEVSPAPEPTPPPTPEQKKPGIPVFLYLLLGLTGIAGIRILLKKMRKKMDERTERDF